MLEQAVPVECGERTSFRASTLRRIIATGGAVVAHALDVFAAYHVGLAGHLTAVSVLRYAQRLLDRIAQAGALCALLAFRSM